MAPEKLYNKPLEEKSDIWSVGVMTYYMLAGYPPFWANEEEKLWKKIKTCDYDFFDEWKDLSAESRDFVSRLLEPNLKLRMSASDALNHKWLN